MDTRMYEDKIALVTGAAGVLGEATAWALLNAGIRPVLVDIDEKKLNGLVARLTEKYPSVEVRPLVLDISDAKHCEKALTSLEDGGIDILINNAGVLSNNKTETTTVDEWNTLIAVNLNSAFYLSKLVVPDMKKKGWGRIINTSSVAAKSGGITAGTAYSTSKGGIISLTFSLAAELAPYGITVNGVAPAYVKTPMVTQQLTEEQRQELLRKIPVHRFCEPNEFAHVVMFLIDPLAGFITGEIIDLNGGLHFD